jgi:hypothetical protein
MTIFLFYPTEDGAQLAPLGERESKGVQEFLDDPVGTYGIKMFADLAYLLEHLDPMYWPEGTGMLIEGKEILPVPAGNMRLP